MIKRESTSLENGGSQKWKQLRRDLISCFPEGRNSEDLNMDRVNSFLQGQGLRTIPCIFIEEGDKTEFINIVRDAGITENNFNLEALSGRYIIPSDMVVIFREEEAEKLNGNFCIEGLAVHELAHASGVSNHLDTSLEEAYFPSRQGFCLPYQNKYWGFFLEEGFADMQRGEYIEKYASSEDRKKWAEFFGSESKDFSLDQLLRLQVAETDIVLPLKYTMIADSSQGKTLIANFSSFAAYSTEILCAKEPSLKEHLIYAREHPETIKFIAKKINDLSAGLYTILQEGYGYNESFAKKLSLVLSVFND